MIFRVVDLKHYVEQHRDKLDATVTELVPPYRNFEINQNIYWGASESCAIGNNRMLAALFSLVGDYDLAIVMITDAQVKQLRINPNIRFTPYFEDNED